MFQFEVIVEVHSFEFSLGVDDLGMLRLRNSGLRVSNEPRSDDFKRCCPMLDHYVELIYKRSRCSSKFSI